MTEVVRFVQGEEVIGVMKLVKIVDRITVGFYEDNNKVIKQYQLIGRDDKIPVYREV